MLESTPEASEQAANAAIRIALLEAENERLRARDAERDAQNLTPASRRQHSKEKGRACARPKTTLESNVVI